MDSQVIKEFKNALSIVLNSQEQKVNVEAIVKNTSSMILKNRIEARKAKKNLNNQIEKLKQEFNAL